MNAESVSTTQMAKEKTVRSSQTLWLFIRWFLPIVVLILIGSVLIGRFKVDQVTNKIKTPESTQTQLASEYLQTELASVSLHLKSLAQYEPVIRRVIENNGGIDTSPMIDQFSSLLLRNPKYSQVRWIGDDGMERVRVHRIQGNNIHTVSLNELQDKHDRDYVIKTLTLKPGQIFVSALDLNIEHGQIEKPLNPMIRFAMRTVRRGGTSNGMIVLNISAQPMLDSLTRYDADGEMVLLNSEGYWLHSPKAEDEWGFMFHKTDTFGQRYPIAWKRISSSKQGQDETPTGLWTWTTVSATAEDEWDVTPVAWKLVSRISRDKLSEIRLDVWSQISIGAALLLLMFGAGIWRLAVEHEARIVAEESLKRKALRLEDANHRLDMEIEQRKRANEELHRIARHDPLTGLANRRAANERLHTEFLSMKRACTAYAVLMIDIDFFKHVNDQYGHAVGDQVLQRVAQTMQATLRESDFCARFGGEEFLALLPATEFSGAFHVAEKLRQAVESSPDPSAGRITVSIGLALANPDHADDDVAVRDADSQLYKAKEAGRNRVMAADISRDPLEQPV